MEPHLCTIMQLSVNINTKVTKGGSHGVGPQFFANFTTITSNFLTDIVCNCHPQGYVSFSTKKSNWPVIFSLISIIAFLRDMGKIVLPLKSHGGGGGGGNKFLFQQ